MTKARERKASSATSGAVVSDNPASAVHRTESGFPGSDLDSLPLSAIAGNGTYLRNRNDLPIPCHEPGAYGDKVKHASPKN